MTTTPPSNYGRLQLARAFIIDFGGREVLIFHLILSKIVGLWKGIFIDQAILDEFPKRSFLAWMTIPNLMGNNFSCYIAEFFSPTARALIGYFEVTWHLTIKLFPAKSLRAGNSAKSMTSESNSALLPANVDRRPPLLFAICTFSFFLCYITSHLMTGPSGNISCCFPRISMFPSAAPRGNIEILGKQNELFPSGPVIKCLMQDLWLAYLVLAVKSI